jgi:PAS domain S-box-containing protein
VVAAAVEGGNEEPRRLPAHILRSVRESIIVMDRAGRITYWSAGATALLGYAAADMLGRTLAVLSPDPAHAPVEQALTAIAAGQDYVGAWRGRRKDGSWIWVDVTTTCLLDEHGEVIGLASAFSGLIV